MVVCGCVSLFPRLAEDLVGSMWLLVGIGAIEELRLSVRSVSYCGTLLGGWATLTQPEAQPRRIVLQIWVSYAGVDSDAISHWHTGTGTARHEPEVLVRPRGHHHHCTARPA
jgi:hypothetical protein